MPEICELGDGYDSIKQVFKKSALDPDSIAAGIAEIPESTVKPALTIKFEQKTAPKVNNLKPGTLDPKGSESSEKDKEAADSEAATFLETNTIYKVFESWEDLDLHLKNTNDLSLAAIKVPAKLHSELNFQRINKEVDRFYLLVFKQVERIAYLDLKYCEIDRKYLIALNGPDNGLDNFCAQYGDSFIKEIKYGRAAAVLIHCQMDYSEKTEELKADLDATVLKGVKTSVNLSRVEKKGKLSYEFYSSTQGSAPIMIEADLQNLSKKIDSLFKGVSEDKELRRLIPLSYSTHPYQGLSQSLYRLELDVHLKQVVTEKTTTGKKLLRQYMQAVDLKRWNIVGEIRNEAQQDLQGKKHEWDSYAAKLEEVLAQITLCGYEITSAVRQGKLLQYLDHYNKVLHEINRLIPEIDEKLHENLPMQFVVERLELKPYVAKSNEFKLDLPEGVQWMAFNYNCNARIQLIYQGKHWWNRESILCETLHAGKKINDDQLRKIIKCAREGGSFYLKIKDKQKQAFNLQRLRELAIKIRVGFVSSAVKIFADVIIDKDAFTQQPSFDTGREEFYSINPNLLKNYLELETPLDENSLFYASALAFLLPAMGDKEQFENNFTLLFGRELSNKEEIKTCLLTYRGEPSQQAAAILIKLIQTRFKPQIIGLIQANIENYEKFFPNTALAKRHLANILKPDDREHAGKAEIMAISQLLETQILVNQNDYYTKATYGENPKQKIYLTQKIIAKNRSFGGRPSETSIVYHYQPCVDKKYIVKAGPEKTVPGSPPIQASQPLFIASAAAPLGPPVKKDSSAAASFLPSFNAASAASASTNSAAAVNSLVQDSPPPKDKGSSVYV